MWSPCISTPFTNWGIASKGDDMLTHQAFYDAELRKIISDEIERRKNNLVAGHQAKGFDFPMFKHHVGIIEGLQVALGLCDEAEKKVNQTYR
jgi:hypothetical protein